MPAPDSFNENERLLAELARDAPDREPPLEIDASPLPPLDLASTLPLGSKWVALDGDALVADIVMKFKLTAAAYRNAMSVMAPGVEHRNLAKLARAVLEMIESALAPYFALNLPDGIESWDDAEWDEPTDRRHKALIPYFPGVAPGDIPMQALPRLARYRVAVILFPRIFPLLKRILLDYASPQRRQAWETWEPVAEPPPLSAAQSAALKRYNEHFFPLASYSAKTASQLIAKSAPQSIRKRVAEDPEFLDALAVSSVSGPKITPFVSVRDTQDGPIRVTVEELVTAIMEVDYTICLFVSILRVNVKSCLESGKNTIRRPMEKLKVLSAILASGSRGPGTFALEQLASCLQFGVKPEALWDRDGNTETLYDVRDVCDGCGKASEKLMRCSRCRVGRYCSPQSQKQSWVAGHKRSCRQIEIIY